jgi:hypothetical protein
MEGTRENLWATITPPNFEHRYGGDKGKLMGGKAKKIDFDVNVDRMMGKGKKE